MLDGFAAHTHGSRVLIEPRLRGLDDVFVFPSFDAALVGRCAPILERACAARLRQVNPHFLAIFISGEVVRQLLAACAIGASCDLSVPTLVTSCATIRWFVVSTALCTL